MNDLLVCFHVIACDSYREYGQYRQKSTAIQTTANKTSLGTNSCLGGAVTSRKGAVTMNTYFDKTSEKPDLSLHIMVATWGTPRVSGNH